jgi:APA family basic amino acid/polyamine antiporter
MVWLLVLVNVWGVRQAGQVQLVSTVLKILPLIAVGAVGIFYLDPAHFSPWNQSGESGFSAVTATAAMTLWAFLGLECANIPAGEVRDPDKNVPRAAVIGTVLAALVYIHGTIAVLGLLGPEQLAQSNAPYADAASILWGPWGYYLIGVGAVISCFGALNGWTLCIGQVPMAAAKDGLFPKFFARESRFGTPAQGIIVSSILVSVLVLMNSTASLVDQFTHVILLATLAALLPYLLCSLARLMIAIKSGQPLGLLDTIVCLLAAAFSIWAIMGTGMETVYWGGFLFMLGLPVHVWVRWHYRGSC